MGVQKGLSLINRLPGFETIIVDSDRRLHFSNGLMRAVQEH
jgi:thiamine biosynthesis lipoprotein